MNRTLTLGLLLLLVVPAHGHFIWILPQPATAQLVFSDELAPDQAVPVTKIGKTVLFGRDQDGKEFAVKMTEMKDHYALGVNAQGPVELAGVCTYGVLAKGKAEPFLLMYYAKSYVGPVDKGELPAHVFGGWSKLPLEIVPAKERRRALKVLWQGKPAAGIEVTLLAPGVADAAERKTDANGLLDIDVRPEADGIYGVRAKFVEKKEGELDGKKYKEVRHYSTFTVRVPASKAKDAAK